MGFLHLAPGGGAETHIAPGPDTRPRGEAATLQALGARDTSASRPRLYTNEDILAKWPKGGPQ